MGRNSQRILFGGTGLDGYGTWFRWVMVGLGGRSLDFCAGYWGEEE